MNAGAVVRVPFQRIDGIRVAMVGLLVGVWTLSPIAQAEPIVLYDSGSGRTIRDYLVQPDWDAERTRVEKTAIQPNPDLLRRRLFPVHTPELTPGPVAVRSIQLAHLPRPIFLIGNDSRSLNWLVQYRDPLLAAHAFGLVVEVATEAEFREIQSLASGLDLTPVAGSMIAKQWKLSHYPVLIGQQRIEQ